jgi:hypothetical protein
MLPDRGVFDMDAYIRWGTASLDAGLAHAYIGVYFPLQYQIFEACIWLSRALATDPVIVLKGANLAFDLGNFAMLLALLGRWRLHPLYALIYWLHPWFLVFFHLGYADFQYVFFLLLALWLLLQRGDTRAGYLAAGVPFAAAVLMKPQALMPAVAFAVYAGVRWKKTGSPDGFFLFLPALLLGGAYQAYFTAALFPSLGRRAIGVLPGWYAHTTSVMPVLTANMLNAWYPVAYVLRQPGTDIFWVSGRIELVPHVQVRYAALTVVLGITAWYACLAAASRRLDGADQRFRCILTFTALVVPALMTAAHENHLFLATVLFVPMLASGARGLAAAAIHATLVMQTVNLEGTYGIDRFARWLQPVYSLEVRVALAILSTICYFFIARELYRAARSGPVRSASSWA